MFKFIINHKKNFLRNNIKYIIAFLLIELLSLLGYSAVMVEDSLLSYALGLTKLYDLDILLLVNKLYIISFLAFITIINFKYIFGYSTSLLASRTTNKKIFLQLIISNFINVVFINIILLSLGVLCSIILGKAIFLNGIAFINALLLELIISYIVLFLYIPKYKLFTLLLFLFVYMFVFSKITILFHIITIIALLFIYIRCIRITDIEIV